MTSLTKISPCFINIYPFLFQQLDEKLKKALVPYSYSWAIYVSIFFSKCQLSTVKYEMKPALYLYILQNIFCYFLLLLPVRLFSSMSLYQTAWFLVHIYFVSLYIIRPIKIDLIGEKILEFSDLWAVITEVITGKFELIYFYMAPIKNTI